MLQVCLSNYGKYTEGYDVSKWITLPFSERELTDTLVNIGVGYYSQNGEYVSGFEENGVHYESIFIKDYDSDLPLSLGEFEDVYELNAFAQYCSQLDKEEYNALHALMISEDTWKEAWEVHKSGDYTYVEHVRTLGDLGRYVAQEYLYDQPVPESLAPYINFEAIGNDWTHYGTLTNIGYIRRI